MSVHYYVWLVPVGKDVNGNDVEYDGIQADDHTTYVEIEL